MQLVCDDRHYLGICLGIIFKRLGFITIDFSILSKFANIAENLVADMQLSRTKVSLLIDVSVHHTNFKNFEYARNLLLPFLDKHCGLLLDIIDVLDINTTVQYLPKITFLMKHGLYACTENVVHIFVSEFLDKIYHQPNRLIEARTMISFLKYEMNGLLTDDHIQKQRMKLKLNIQSRLAMMEGRFEDAIADLSQFFQMVTLRHGREAIEAFETLWEICSCYIKFGDKTRAVQTLNRMKRIKKNHPCIAKCEKLIRQMRESGKRSRIRVARTLCKCSNPYCSKVEQKKGEFSLCDRCEIVKYCSRQCQVQHWKAGHRKQCEK